MKPLGISSLCIIIDPQLKVWMWILIVITCLISIIKTKEDPSRLFSGHTPEQNSPSSILNHKTNKRTSKIFLGHKKGGLLDSKEKQPFEKYGKVNESSLRSQ